MNIKRQINENPQMPADSVLVGFTILSNVIPRKTKSHFGVCSFNSPSFSKNKFPWYIYFQKKLSF